MPSKFAGHTKGPLLAADDCGMRADGKSTGYAAVFDRGGHKLAVVFSGDAPLFAAAPDLLAACEAMRTALTHIVNDSPSPGEDAELTAAGYNKACAAITLADRVLGK